VNLKSALGVAPDLGVRLNVLGILPTAVLVTFITALVASGAPGSAPDVSELVDKLEDLSGTDAILLTAGNLVLALIFQPVQLPLVRIFEGYWGAGPIGRTAARLLVKRQQRRRARLERAATPSDVDDPELPHRIVAAWRLRNSYPPNALLLPTALGNVLRAAEYRAGRPYGLDAVVVWPRLYPLLKSEVRAVTDDLRLQMDVAARFSAVFVIGAVISLGLLARHGWWLLVPAGSLVLGWISYRSTVAAAGAYGMSIETAFDLTHLDLRAALHLPRPSDRATEREENKQLTEFLRGVPTELHYESE
jgi:hypothetical protein